MMCVCGICDECTALLRAIPTERWEDDTVQFPRLLAELRAVDIPAAQLAEVCDSMDIDPETLEELFTRAERRWNRIKAEVCQC